MANDFKVRDELRPGLDFYLPIIAYYRQFFSSHNIGHCPRDGWKGYGEIEFYHKDFESVAWTLEFWESALVWHIENEYRRRVRAIEKKSKKKEKA